MPLRDLVGSLSEPDRIPQIEVAVGDRATALVLRHLLPLTAPDIAVLRAFAERYDIQWWLQSKGPDTVHPLVREHETELAYTLPEFGLRMPFRPTDFTQVNQQINRALVSRALGLLQAGPGDRVADLFCGLGNFTLPLATQAREVLGVEGSGLFYLDGSADTEFFVHGKAGVTLDKVALYAISGIGTYNFGTFTLWDIGAGAEVALTDHLTLDGQLFGREEVGVVPDVLHIQVGLRYHF